MTVKAKEIANDAVLTMLEKRMFLARVVRMKGAAIDETKDADLINGVKYDKHGRRMLTLPDKRACIELDAKLAGELAQDRAADKQAEKMGELAAALARIQHVTHGRTES
ncbi:hypothetical protein WJU23_05295 [Prosthecobacter sp. SYSU 5D2]|uniref:hypothetical protein n=1 Tax=Prosthecobacter sp. SYSU 5D2 TaxID=3134134 RepID=UPI0031FEEE8D